jgi:hypothetical protein
MNATDKLQATVRTLGIKIRIMYALTPHAKEAGSDNEIEIWQAYRVSRHLKNGRPWSTSNCLVSSRRNSVPRLQQPWPTDTTGKEAGPSRGAAFSRLRIKNDAAAE